MVRGMMPSLSLYLLAQAFVRLIVAMVEPVLLARDTVFFDSIWKVSHGAEG